MIERYTRPEMAGIWSEEARLQRWLDVELALVEELAARGEVPAEAARVLRRDARIDVARMQAIEAEVKHDVIAFVSSVAERLGDESRFLHLGLTSSDVVDTAFAMQLRDAADLLLAGVDRLRAAVRAQAEAHKHTAMIGRTHGIHAEPITFGLKCAGWYAELGRGRRVLAEARALIAHGKLSGAVGTFGANPPAVEAGVCGRLGLTPEPLATQVVPRDRHAHFFTRLAVLAGTCERIATEIRHLQRTEVGEALEPFGRGQKGSSAMPHKRNPVLSENISGLSRLIRSYALAALEDVALWHERDISHSSVERVIGPDATITLDFMLGRFTGMMEKLIVYPERMMTNLNMTHGVIFSQMVLLALIEKGTTREDAYAIVQQSAMKSWQEGLEFRELLEKDPIVAKYLQKKDLAAIFDVNNFLKNLDFIFNRVFGEK